MVLFPNCSRGWFVFRLLPIVATLISSAKVNADSPLCHVQVLIPDEADRLQWTGISLDVDGGVLITGAPEAPPNARGAVYAYRNSGGRWLEEARVAISSLPPGANLGFRIALDMASGEGRFVAGAHDINCTSSLEDCGEAFVFELNGGEWTQQARLVPDNQVSGDQAFGFAVDIEGDRVVVGAPWSNDVYVFEYAGGVWQRMQKIGPGEPTGLFGSSLALVGNTLFIGAEWDDEVANDAGAVFVFRRDEGGIWRKHQKLTPSNSDARLFGTSVSASGNRVIVGARGGSFRIGRAYIFDRDEASGFWTERAELAGSDGHANDGLGYAVDVLGDTAIAGALQHGTDFSGAAYLFQLQGSSWTETAKLVPLSPGASDAFGSSVKLTEEAVFVGAFFDDKPDRANTGSVTVFLREGVLAGNVNTGDGSPPADVLLVNGSRGDDCRRVVVTAGVPADVSILPAPDGNGGYAVWLSDFDRYAGWPLQYRKGGGTTYDLGMGVMPLPVNNSVSPGSVPCPLEFPRGFTSQALGAGAAARFCLNPRPGHPRAPVTFPTVFPRGNFILGGLVRDRNSRNSPALDVSIANWVLVSAR